jgi:branched-subunit amino acid transport protein
MSAWGTVLLASAIAFTLKFAGYLVPADRLQRPRISRVTALLPPTLLAALVVVQTFTTGEHLVLDARVGGLIAAFVALLLRAPFIVVVIAAAATAAGLRALGAS